MEILHKFKETAASVLPVAAIVLLLGLTFLPEIRFLLPSFLLGSFLLTIGLTIFLLGVDVSITPVGERFGTKLTEKRSLSLLLGAAFVVGFIVTAAEPDIQVFGDQVRSVFNRVSKAGLTYSIAGGVGLFMALGLTRIMMRISFKWTILLFYAILVVAAIFAPRAFVGIAFDSGGATTGPMTVPFIMAIGLGVSTVRRDRDASFGLTGIASVGPVLAVLLYSMGADTMPAEANVISEALEGGEMGMVLTKEVVHHSIRESFASIWPLLAMTILAHFLLLKMSKRQLGRVGVGFIYAFLGLSIFLIGVNGGFVQAGQALGDAFGNHLATDGGQVRNLWFALMIVIGLAFGAIIVCAEPAVWVLSEQVEQISNGVIRRKTLLVFLSVGTAIAIALAMWRAVAGFHIAWILLPGYLAAMVLMPFCPTLFSGIAFDSGGVASGPLTSSFVLSFALGAASGASPAEAAGDSFGVIALVAMMPLIAIQIMGILFHLKQKAAMRRTEKEAI